MVTLFAILLAVYLLGCAIAFVRLVRLAGFGGAVFLAFNAGLVFDWPFVLFDRLQGRHFGGS